VLRGNLLLLNLLLLDLLLHQLGLGLRDPVGLVRLLGSEADDLLRRDRLGRLLSARELARLLLHETAWTRYPDLLLPQRLEPVHRLRD
jgi:hypothetical protein